MRLAKLSCAQAANLVRLNAGESLPRSQLPKSVLLPLQEAGVVSFEKSASSYVVRGIPGKLAAFVEHHWGVRDLARYASTAPEDRTRELMAEIASDSKALPNQPFDGIFIRSFGNCYLGDDSLGQTPPGSAMLITVGELPRLSIKSEALVAVENARCLFAFEKALPHFPVLQSVNCALVLRWHWGGPWRRWLEQWKGNMLYFPDYDPAGLGIFASEVLPFRAQAELLIPQNFEGLLEKFGRRDLFLEQEQLLPAGHPNEQLQRLSAAVNRARKGLEQEQLLSLRE
jgi:hypothetical protein